MATTIAGSFENRAAAQHAIERLQELGVPAADISLIVRNTAGDEPVVEGFDTARDIAGGAATGGLLGALGGLLAGLGAIAIPGIGPILAAGPLAAALAGSAIGAAAGGLIAALIDLGIPEEYAHTYGADVERGYVVLAVRADVTLAERIREILAGAGATNLYPTVFVV